MVYVNSRRIAAFSRSSHGKCLEKRGRFDHAAEISLGLCQDSVPSTISIVILNVIASMEQHSCDVVQLGQEALCPHHLQKMHSDKNRH